MSEHDWHTSRQLKELESDLTETNAAFSEAVHMHQQERAALALLLEKAEAESDALKADAGRYRWLRQNMTHYNPAEQSGPVLWGARIWYHASNNVEYPIDAAIDAAMKKDGV
jgi:hypothetical protein